MDVSDNVTIIIPVYGDWPSLNECIESLKQNIDFKKHKAILINDCGPDDDFIENKIKHSIEDYKSFAYFRNPENLGFVKTCNRGVLELDKTNNHILLLNSDTKVTEGFLEEMLEILNTSSKIAVVSPRSNNATLATIPISSAQQKGIDKDKSYETFLKIKDKLPRYNEVPTTHGFCMLIKRDVIKKYGLFDEVFGKGYGEENDFCLRVQKHGYKCVLSNRAYVFHLEARSFSLEAKSKILENNLKILYERWPEYRQAVRKYMVQAQEREAKAEMQAGIKTNYSESKLKSLIKRNPHLHKLASKIHNKIK